MVGAVELTKLPPSLEQLKFRFTAAGCTIDLTALPPNMTLLRLDNNLFRGAIDLSRLPRTMKQLWLDRNQLSGTARLDESLPPSLELIALHKNSELVVSVSASKALPPYCSYDGKR